MGLLLIDVGNTNLKWSMASSQGELSTVDQVATDSDLDNLFNDCKQPERIVVSSVSSDTHKQTLSDVFKKRWKMSAEFLVSPATGFGITNAYSEPQLLGSDRWAAMIAAYQVTGSAVLVVDAGTALTIDAIDDQGQHLGGLITPGFGLSREVLASRTQLNINEFSLVQDSAAFFGRSTQECIVAGASHAASNLIGQAFAQLSANDLTNQPICYLTGGDALHLNDQLPCPYQYEPHLVLKGLALIATAA